MQSEAGIERVSGVRRAVVWTLRLLVLAALAILCRVVGSWRPAIAFAVALVPGIVFVTAYLAGVLRFPRCLVAVYPWEPVLYRWIGVGLAKRLVATRLWPEFVGVVPPPKPTHRHELLDYTEGATRGAEISHWASFVVALLIATACLCGGRSGIAAWILVFNVLINGYPIMVQRSNRWRVQQVRATVLAHNDA